MHKAIKDKEMREDALNLVLSELPIIAKQINKNDHIGHYNKIVESKIKPHLENIVFKVGEFFNSVSCSASTFFAFGNDLKKNKIKINERLNVSLGFYFNEYRKFEVSLDIASTRGRVIMHVKAMEGRFLKKSYIHPIYCGNPRLKHDLCIEKGKPVELLTGTAIPIAPLFDANGMMIWEAVVGDRITHIQEHPPIDSMIEL